MRLGGLAVALLLLGAVLRAQEADHRTGDYNVVNSFEFGYRAAFVNGNQETYRSAVNYNNGLRLFDGLLRVNSRDGHGRFFDELVLTTFGSGGDPYQSNSLRVEKNRLYRFDMGFRVVNYYNQLLALSGGQHRFNTEHILQNYDLTLFPTRRFQIVAGYDRSNWNGPALTSESFNVLREAAFPRESFFVFADRVRRLNNTWRLGTNFTARGLQFSLLQGWDYFKDDTTNSPPLPGDAGTGLVAPTFRRSDPVHGRTPFSRLNVHSDANRLFAVNGRLVYSGGRRNFVLDENISNLNPASNVLVNRQSFVLGAGERSQATGDLTLTYQPGQRWTLSNTTSFHQMRITGDSAFVEVRTPQSSLDPGVDQYFFDYLGDRLFTNSTDVNFQVNKVVGLNGGYRYSLRRLQSREALQEPGSTPFENPLYSFDNTTHSVLAGFRLRPRPPLTISVDAEYGEADHPFVLRSERRYHDETARAQWRSRTWQLTGALRYYRNRNAGPRAATFALANEPFLPNYLQVNRNYSVGAAWTPAHRFAFDASYVKLHLETSSPIVNFPVSGALAPYGRQNLYLSNLHQVHGTFRWEVASRLTLFLGYSVVKDTGDGRSRLNPVAPFVPAYPNVSFNGTDLIDVYPLTYQSPQGRLSVRLHPRLSWNANWQYYGFSEKFTGLQNYFANVLTTSLRWAF